MQIDGGEVVPGMTILRGTGRDRKEKMRIGARRGLLMTWSDMVGLWLERNKAMSRIERSGVVWLTSGSICTHLVNADAALSKSLSSMAHQPSSYQELRERDSERETRG